MTDFKKVIQPKLDAMAAVQAKLNGFSKALSARIDELRDQAVELDQLEEFNKKGADHPLCVNDGQFQELVKMSDAARAKFDEEHDGAYDKMRQTLKEATVTASVEVTVHPRKIGSELRDAGLKKGEEINFQYRKTVTMLKNMEARK